MSQEGFLMDAWQAMVFFRVCRRYKVETQEDRVLVLRAMARKKDVNYIREVSDFTAGKNYLRITKGEKRAN